MGVRFKRRGIDRQSGLARLDADLHGQQGVAAERVEVVVDTDWLVLQHGLPDIHQSRLGRGAWRHIGQLAWHLHDIRPRQRPAIDLAVGRQGDALQRHEHAWDHVVGQPVLQRGPHLRRIQRLLGDDIGHQELALAIGLLLPVNQRGLHAGQRLDRALDLAQLDPEAVHLHLEVGPAQEFHLSIRQPSAEVAGVIDALACRRIGDEGGVGLLPVLPIAARQAHAAHEDPPRHKGRALIKPVIEHEHLLVEHRAAIRDGGPDRIHLADGVPVGDDGGLRRPTHAPDRRTGRERPHAVRQVGWDLVAAHHEHAHAGQRLARLHPHIRVHRHAQPDRCLMLARDFHPMQRLQMSSFIRDHHAGAGREHAEDVVDRQVEGEIRQLQRPVAGPDTMLFIGVAQCVHDAEVRQRHAFRLAGRAGGEQHVTNVAKLVDRGWAAIRFVRPQSCVIHRQARATQPVQHALLAQHDVYLALLDHAVHAFGRPGSVDRQIAAARLQDGHAGHRLLPAFLHHHGDQRVRLDAPATQAMRDAVGQPLHLTVAQHALSHQQRRRLRLPCRPVGERVV